MGPTPSLTSLEKQQNTVIGDMQEASEKIDDLTEKISRLRKASSSLETSIQSLKRLKEKVDDYEVSESKWKGDEQISFMAKYNSFGVYVGIYDSDTSEAKEKIEEALASAKAEKLLAKADLDSLQDSFNRLNSDITAKKED